MVLYWADIILIETFQNEFPLVFFPQVQWRLQIYSFIKKI